ncbi:MAG: hypothetical protein L3J41_05710 [Melioribacteraceae bacterium]|nr:hypothetical protein [Melioribacteraceae bacterium]
MGRKFHYFLILLATLIIISTTIVLFYFGWDYYSLPLKERFFHPNHDLLKSSGLLGHGLGIVGTLMMVIGVAVYIIRKRVKRFHRLGKLKHWLEFHIFLTLLGPILVLFHTAFRFGGIVSISFWCMVAVVLSGIIGRFIYLQIPRSIEGNELSQDEMSKLNIKLKFELKEKYKLESSLISSLDENSINQKNEIRISQIVKILIIDIIETRKKLSEIKKYLRSHNVPSHREKEIIKISKSKLLLTRKILLLKTTQKLFGYWHVFHLPFAIVMLVIMVVHVVVALMFGYKWIF